MTGYIPVQSALDEKKKKERNYLFTLHSEMFSRLLSRLIHVSSQFLLPFLNLTQAEHPLQSFQKTYMHGILFRAKNIN